MFRFSTIIRELALNLAKVIFILKHSVKFFRYLLCGCVAACQGMACVFCALQNVTPHNKYGRNFTEYFNVNITLARFSASSLMMVED